MESNTYYDGGLGGGQPNNPYYSPETLETQPIGLTAELTPGGFPLGQSYSNNRDARKLARSYAIAEQAEHHKARLTRIGMGYTLQLSALADQISEATPSAEQSCRAIVQGYALSVAVRAIEF